MEGKQELYQILEKQVRKYTSGESSSVTWERARELMEGILYSIRHAQPGSEETEILAGPVSLTECYAKGQQNILQKVQEAKTLYENLLPGFVSCGNRALQDTVLKGMPGFFLYYDARFFPQNTILTLDYPLLEDLGQLSGVDRIRAYLQCIYREQKFLKAFPEAYLHQVLREYHPDHEEQLINLPELVLVDLLEAGLTGRTAGERMCTSEEKNLFVHFCRQERGKMEEDLRKWAEKLLDQLSLSEEGEKDYFCRCIPDLCARWRLRAEQEPWA